MKWELVWDSIYSSQGEVQSEVLPTVINAVQLFKNENIKTVLDLGCGTGRHSIYLAKAGFEVTATDISEFGIDIAKEKAQSQGLDIEFLCHDMRQIPFNDNTFDAVLCVWTSGHGLLKDMITHAQEMVRVTKPNGFIVVDYVSKKDNHYGVGIEIEKDTFINNMPSEEDIPHHYTDEKELLDIYSHVAEINIKPYSYSFYDNQNNIHYIQAMIVVCKKTIGSSPL